ncbi:MAG: hypothetical protein HY074_13695 [Deltaproteobacteria bacterium]|nr:hypothetical protein [Deltaproteobacteria bacterium]
MRTSANCFVLSLSLLLVLGFASGCVNPPGDPNCQSGVGQLYVQNNAGEAVTISISDATGDLPAFSVAGNGGKKDEETPVGIAHVSAVGATSHTTLLSGNYSVMCDAQTIISISNAPMFGLSVSASGSGRGIVTSMPAGISCGSICATSFAPQSQVTLKAAATTNSTFSGWGGACAGTTGSSCTVAMTQAQDVTVQFDSTNPTQTYPATHPALPVLINHGGHVLADPVFVSVTFPDDALATSLEQFGSQVGVSSFWAPMSEYGVGAATAGTPVHVSVAAPATIDDAGIQTWLASMLDGTHVEFGTPTANTLYVLYYPTSTTSTIQGLSSCTDFDGYHSDLRLSSGLYISYAVIARCKPSAGQTQLEQLTSTASHEMAEAASDALPFDNTAVDGVVQSQNIWDTMSFGSEVSDMCQRYDSSYYQPADLAFQVQRYWSNAAAAASADPCAPNSAVYFNSAPIANDAVKYLDSGSFVSTRGVLLAVGQTTTIPIALFSNAPTGGPWQVSAMEDQNSVSNLDLAFDKTSGQNGDTLQLTITVKSKNATFDAELVWIKSQLNGQSHYWPLVVAQQAGVATASGNPLSTLASRHGAKHLLSKKKKGGFEAEDNAGATILY